MLKVELYDHILESSNPETLAYTNKSILKKERQLLTKTMTGMMMTMQYGDISYEKELSQLEQRLDKIDTCLSLIHKKIK